MAHKKLHTGKKKLKGIKGFQTCKHSPVSVRSLAKKKGGLNAIEDKGAEN